MDSSISILSTFLLLLVSPLQTSCRVDQTSFNDNYYVSWGHDHALLLNQDKEIQLSLDQKSGAGFESKLRYGSGAFNIRMKLPDKNSTGIVTTFYLASRSSHHDEIDIEFLGGPEYKLHTNVFTYGQGGREQQIHLWFDPTKDFHSYKILWNPYQIVFFVDNIPIRVFKNNIKTGIGYPTQPMQIIASIWKDEGWGSGGKKIDWSQQPFQAHYQNFHVDGCVLKDYSTGDCNSSRFWWNSKNYWRLNADQERAYQNVRSKYLVYDYCSRKASARQHPECQRP